MSSPPFVTNHHPYQDTSSSCSSLEISCEEEEEEEIVFNNQSSPIQSEKKKEPIYYEQRSRNNLSAKRSRVKRRMNDLVLETKLTRLTSENEILRAKIAMLKRKFDRDDQQLFKSTEQSPVLNTILDQSSVQTTQPNPDSIPVKLRFKLLNITSES